MLISSNTVLMGRFDKFQLALESLVTKSTFEEAMLQGDSINLPDEIIHGFLWIGDAKQAVSMYVHEKLGFTHIVNASACMNLFSKEALAVVDQWDVADEMKLRFTKFISERQEELPLYLRIKVLDKPTENLILNHLDQMIQFISPDKIDSKRVLIHCQAGVSRSATLVLGYLMKVDRMTFSESMKLVKSKRNKVLYMQRWF